jgi:hypothetical protein
MFLILSFMFFFYNNGEEEGRTCSEGEGVLALVGGVVPRKG